MTSAMIKVTKKATELIVGDEVCENWHDGERFLLIKQVIKSPRMKVIHVVLAGDVNRRYKRSEKVSVKVSK